MTCRIKVDRAASFAPGAWRWKCPWCGSTRANRQWGHLRALNAARLHWQHCEQRELSRQRQTLPSP